MPRGPSALFSLFPCTLSFGYVKVLTIINFCLSYWFLTVYLPEVRLLRLWLLFCYKFVCIFAR